MMKKRMLALLLALALLLPSLPLAAQAEAPETGEEDAQYPDELIVGHPTEMRGDFFTEMFGNNTADIDVRSLIHGYNLVNWDQNQGVYVFDPTVVTETRVMEDAEGNRTYFLAIADDLYYSDGTHITAWDYAFSLLLMMAPEMEEIGAKIYRAEHILGYREYITGQYSALTGVNVLSDYQLAITLDKEFLPFFFETGLFLCVPYPIHVIAPGCRVYDDGLGIYIGNEDQTIAQPIFTAELLQKTILDPETGYNSHPAVVSGPYILKSFDGLTAHFEINPYYKGTWVQELPAAWNDDISADEDDMLDEDEALDEYEEESQELPLNYTPVIDEENGEILYYVAHPQIPKIAFSVVKSEDVPQLFADGELHLVNKLVYGPAITEMMQNMEETEARAQPYPRLGMTFLTFTCDWPTVREKEVRQAIAWCMDRDALTLEYCQGYGLRTDGYYGIEKWEYMLVSQQIDPPVHLLESGQTIPESQAGFENLYARNDAEYDEMIEAWNALSLDQLTPYTVDLDAANTLLNQAGWTLNRDGEPYRPGVDEVRCKLIDGELIALDLKMMYPEGNRIVDTIQENFIDHLNAVGILLTLVPATMDDLLTSYYRETERTTDMIYLGTNFHVVVDPSITYSADTQLAHERWNNTFSDDEELYQRAVEMRKTHPGDLYGYITKWIAFQERYNEVLPAIPIYTNIYFDFNVPYLQNYYITAHVTWGQAIVESYFGETVEAVEDEEDIDLDGDDEALFFDD